VTWDRGVIVDHQLRTMLEDASARAKSFERRDLDEPIGPDEALTRRKLLELVESQFLCRHLDLIARELRARDAGYYTIGSAGHEGNAVLGALARKTDPTFLHYRSGALMLERMRQDPSIDRVMTVLLAQAASSEDPVAGGRHKVWGGKSLWVPPQTSTIGSHLPKAVGAAIALERAQRWGCREAGTTDEDSVIVCSFGDASVNHSAAQGAFNAASWAAFQKIPVPIVFVCEDNGIGISVRTPDGWIEASMRSRPAITYVPGDGLDLVDAWEAAGKALAHCRRTRSPVFLHLRTIRMLGHAGSDIEHGYHRVDQIEATEQRDPLLRSARLLIDHGVLDAEETLALYEDTRRRVAEAADVACERPKLRDARDVMIPLAPHSPAAVREEALREPPPIVSGWLVGTRRGTHVRPLPPLDGPRHMAVLINRALHEALEKYRDAMVFGEDVAQKGGVYNVTHGLWKRFGGARVFNTLLDETTILGMAIGAAHLGMLPIPEIQYLAYYHNAQDQIRGEACSLSFFSNAQFNNGMVVRVQGLAYQKGFGGHFHNDNSLGALRDVPGLVVACPSRGDDAVRLMRTCLALARIDGRVVVFLEPIALYMKRDLIEPGDRRMLFDVPAPGDVADFLEPRVSGEDRPDLAIVTYANGAHMSERVADRLRREDGLRVRIVDLRWLAPLPAEAIVREVSDAGRVLVVDECRRAGGLGEAIAVAIREGCGDSPPTTLLAAHDTYVPLGPAMTTVMPTEDDILAAARGHSTRANGWLSGAADF
jgi:2-oxoisovalerate dehydrogenase E1 component